MKKVLLASTALAMTAGMAAAEVTLSGYAEMGVKSVPVFDETEGDYDNSVRFHHDMDVKFTLSGETDGGLSFGATVDLDEVANGIGADDVNDNAKPSVFVSGDFGTLTMGDTDGAFDWAMSEIAWGTAIADDHSSHAGWNGNSGLDGQLDGQVARYDYSFGDFAVAVSAEIGDDNDADFGDVLDEDNTFFDDDEIFGIGAKYSTDLGGASVGFGLGYQTGEFDDGDLSGNADIWGLSVSADMTNGFKARLNYSRLDGDVGSDADTDVEYDWTHWGVGVAYEMDALLVEANYGRYDLDVEDADDDEADGWGLAVNYDLGGGAVFMVGYGHSDPFADGENYHSWSAGVGLSF